MRCPCCGGEVETIPADSLTDLKLTPMRRKLVSALVKAFPRPVSTAYLKDYMWAEDPYGGPDSDSNTLDVQISMTNRELRQIGWRIKAMSTGLRGLERV